ncbi:MAG: CRISPR-associated RAMP Cmr2 [uncultured Sulfurovum sp.]|uniref:CRISPR-associated RAMP Cmr2 n=2 Tax=uncultured Sulfurovum sp. TaxID=269237 RepID=A0A6S6SS71_9BACT|nr:MAG: CRISPR-associated RAMP Cmr2 [uncultured Sulfurovum sp.]
MKYIALTIGPIVDTLSLGRKTSEVWMASYLFSSFMKNSIRKIRERSDAQFIIPFVDDEVLKEQDNGVGMFHDRFILQSDTLSLESIEEILQEEKDAFSSMVAKSIKKDEAKVKAFFTQYLQTYLFETREAFENPILDISKIMDSIELHTPILEAKEDYMRLFLNRDIILDSSLAKVSFGKKPSFEAIDAIAAQELDKDIEAKNAHKYIAIIYADGDNLGEYIKSQSDVTEVSKRLFDFDKKAAQTIENNGALPIFIGGDDLIIFAPLLNNGKTVFDLLNQLSKDYKEALGTDKSTLSFGVSLTYYKYPLYEALERARNTLFGVAKEHKGKNAIAISTQKHSGQSFDFCIGKDEEAYDIFLTLIERVLTETVELPHAIHHKLQSHQKVFDNIPLERLQNTFENIFNEDIHKEKFEEGLKSIENLMQSLGLEEKAQKKLFSMLSTIKVLRGDR